MGTYPEVLLDRVRQEWIALGPSRPAGVWIREYRPLGPDQNGVDDREMPVAAWYLDESGTHERTPWAWARLHLLHFDQPWRAGIASPPSAPVFSGGTWELGLAAFASYVGGERYYLEVLWGDRYGSGASFTVSPEGGLVLENVLWKS